VRVSLSVNAFTKIVTMSAPYVLVNGLHERIIVSEVHDTTVL
jgi:hypothetical protein